MSFFSGQVFPRKKPRAGSVSTELLVLTEDSAGSPSLASFFHQSDQIIATSQHL